MYTFAVYKYTFLCRLIGIGTILQQTANMDDIDSHFSTPTRAATRPPKTPPPARHPAGVGAVRASDREPHAGSDWSDDAESARLPDASSTNQDGQRRFENVHVYGSAGALSFEADSTRGGSHTVRLEGATSSGQRVYAWADKVAVQFTAKELPVVLGVLLGWIPSASFKAHGEKKEKGFSLERQDGGKVFARVWKPGRAVAVPIFAMDLYPVVTLLVRQMARNEPDLGVDGVLGIVRALAPSLREGAAPADPRA
jgi:hypothetical protein